MLAREIARGVRRIHGPSKMQVSISPEGKAYASGTETFYERLGFTNPDFDVGDYVVRHLGFIVIYRRSNDRVMVRLRPSLVSKLALDSAMRHLIGQKFVHGEIQFYDQEWTSEAWSKTSELLHRLVELCDRPHGPDEPTFGLKPLGMERLSNADSNPMKPLYQKWKVSCGIFDDTTLPFIIEYGLHYRLMVVAADSPGEPLRFQYIGDGFRPFSSKQKSELLGSTITQMPVLEYGYWLEQHYADVAKNGHPSFDYVTAKYPISDRRLQRTQYERLLLPWRTGQGKTLVTCSSIVISSVIESTPK